MSTEGKTKDEIQEVVDDSDDSSDDEEEDVLQCKLVVLGDGMVGKTSLIKQFVHGDSAFDKSYCQTIGLNFYSKDLELQGKGGQHHKIRMQLWDIGGQSIGSKMIANYIFNANIVLLVYDGTSQSSFENLDDWYGKVKECLDAHELRVPCVTALVGNKSESSFCWGGDGGKGAGGVGWGGGGGGGGGRKRGYFLLCTAPPCCTYLAPRCAPSSSASSAFPSAFDLPCPPQPRSISRSRTLDLHLDLDLICSPARGSRDWTPALDGDPGKYSRIHEEESGSHGWEGGATTFYSVCQDWRQRPQPVLLHGRNLCLWPGS